MTTLRSIAALTLVLAACSSASDEFEELPSPAGDGGVVGDAGSPATGGASVSTGGTVAPAQGGSAGAEFTSAGESGGAEPGPDGTGGRSADSEAGAGGTGGATPEPPARCPGIEAGEACDPREARLVLLAGGPGDDPLSQLSSPGDVYAGIALNGDGQVYVADGAIRRIAVDGSAVTNLPAGPIAPAFTGTMTADYLGNLYFATKTAIFQVVIATGETTVLAGAESTIGRQDGFGDRVLFWQISEIVSDGGDNLYINDDRVIRRLEVSTRRVTTLAGGAGTPVAKDGIGSEASFDYHYVGNAMATDCGGNLYVADSALRKVVLSTGEVSTWKGTDFGYVTALASNCTHLYASVGINDGSATIYELDLATGSEREIARLLDVKTALALDCEGNLYARNWQSGKVTKIVLESGEETVLAASKPLVLSELSPSDLDGAGPAARFTSPWRVVSDGADALYVFDINSPSDPNLGIAGARLRRVNVATGAVETIAGSFEQSSGKDGLGDGARFGRGGDMVVDGDVLYALDGDGPGALHRVNLSTRAVSTLDVDLGNNGALLALGSDGALYTSGQSAILRIDKQTGAVTVLAGDLIENDRRDGIGTEARFGVYPNALVADGRGSLFLCESNAGVDSGWGSSIRRIDEVTGQVTTIAGSATLAGTDDGIGADARFANFFALASDGDDTLYALDRVFVPGPFSGQVTRLRKITVSTGEVTTIAGTTSRRGLDLCTADLDSPDGLAVLPSGEVVVVDSAAKALLRLDPR